MIVEALRQSTAGPWVETAHPTHIAITDAQGQLLASTGDPQGRIFARSCAKPFQALSLFTSGAATQFDIRPEELALASASHEGAEPHTSGVQAWLQRLQLTPQHLECGAHPPGDREALALLGGRPPSPLHNNCSGKHAGQLATSLALGAPTKGYTHRLHPTQRAVADTLATLLPDRPIDWAVDGCSLPTPLLALQDLATLYAQLASPFSLQGRAPTLAEGLLAIGPAMHTHAELVGGRGVLDTVLMRALHGILAKRGADGVYALSLLPDGPRPALGIAIKVSTGSAEAREAVVMTLLDALGVLNPAARFALKDRLRPPRTNWRGLQVGHWHVPLPPLFSELWT